MNFRAPVRMFVLALAVLGIALLGPSRAAAAPAGTSTSRYEFNDAHFHLTNYIQEGIDVHRYLKLMGNRVGRSTLFGIPLQ